jgi:pimeloyl-ACP methyl ester carboxylesterase
MLACLFAATGNAQSLPDIAEGPDSTAFWDAIPRTVAEGSRRGDIYWMRERSDAPAGGRGWNVIYVSEGASGGLQYVSGEIYVPRAPAPTLRPIVVWATGTAGFQDSCAPSRTALYRPDGRVSRVPGIEQLLAQGYVVVMSDYQGQGTPGPTEFVQGEPQAMASFDVARAARHFPYAHAGTDIGIYGFSQGGQTALWSAHIADEYAPEFNVVGIAPIAPASRHVDLSFYDLDIPANAGYFIARMAGLQVGHPELSLRDILTEAGLELLAAQSWGCYEIFDAAAALAEPYAKPEALQPGTPWRQRLEENDEFLPFADAIPVFMIQGDSDIDVPVELTREVNSDLCDLGIQLEYLEISGAGHMGVFAPSAAVVPRWFDDRFTGEPAHSICRAE